MSGLKSIILGNHKLFGFFLLFRLAFFALRLLCLFVTPSVDHITHLTLNLLKCRRDLLVFGLPGFFVKHSSVCEGIRVRQEHLYQKNRSCFSNTRVFVIECRHGGVRDVQSMLWEFERLDIHEFCKYGKDFAPDVGRIVEYAFEKQIE